MVPFAELAANHSPRPLPRRAPADAGRGNALVRSHAPKPCSVVVSKCHHWRIFANATFCGRDSSSLAAGPHSPGSAGKHLFRKWNHSLNSANGSICSQARPGKTHRSRPRGIAPRIGTVVIPGSVSLGIPHPCVVPCRAGAARTKRRSSMRPGRQSLAPPWLPAQRSLGGWTGCSGLYAIVCSYGTLCDRCGISPNTPICESSTNCSYGGICANPSFCANVTLIASAAI
jgi:hypothetical protein